MKSNKLILAMALTLAAGQQSFAQSAGCDVAIINRGFEDPVLAEDGFTYTIPGWTVAGDAGAFNPGALTYTGGNVAEGNNCVFLSCCVGGRSAGVVRQTLQGFLTENTTYDLSMSVGQRLDAPWANFRVQLIAGATPVIDTLVTAAPTAGTFNQRNFQFVCPAGHAAAGGQLQIRISHEGAGAHQANCDGFQLVATPNCVSICTQPAEFRACRGGSGQFTAAHAGVGPFTYRWFRNNVALTDRTNPWGSVVTGAFTRTLSISNIREIDNAEYRLVVTNGCGNVSTETAQLLVCAADFNCDGAVDLFDYLDFVSAFGTGAAAADWNEDGVIDFFDYLDFVFNFSTGC